MIEYLRRIGLSDLEARCYLTLHEESRISGYEVAKRVSVSRSNVYAALRSLADKGGCRMTDGDPVLYDAVPIDQLIGLLKSEFEQTANVLATTLKTPPKPAPGFYSWTGTDQVDKAIQRLVSNASKSIIVDIWAEDLHRIEESLVGAEQRGTTVILVVLGACETSLKNVTHHKHYDIPSDIPRKFSVLCDSSSAILGSFAGWTKPSALETEHSAVIDMLKNAFYHDVIMNQIEADFGPEITSKYGEQYETLRKKYEFEKGWVF